MTTAPELGLAEARSAGQATAEPAADPGRDRRAGPDARLKLVLITGLSGAGRTTALKILEDLGYEVVDNLPLSLLERVVFAGNVRPLAVGFDTRTRGFADAVLDHRLDQVMGDPSLDVRLVFFTCSEEALRRRFTETRRRHPLALDRPVIDGIHAEQRLVAPLQARADLVVDTTDLALPELRRLLHGHFALDPRPGIAIAVTSFSYRYGLPPEADLVFDVRFLRNPHYHHALRHLTGADAAVAHFIEADAGFAPFFEGLTRLLAQLLPGFAREGKSYLTLAVGCTGGRHRSVFVAERLARWLREQDHPVTLLHRDVGTPPRALG